ncbi:hypothetical protein [Moraxella lacunata]
MILTAFCYTPFDKLRANAKTPSICKSPILSRFNLLKYPFFIF